METPFKRDSTPQDFGLLTEEEFSFGEALSRLLGYDVVNAMLTTERETQKRRVSAIVSVFHTALAERLATLSLSSSSSPTTASSTPPPNQPSTGNAVSGDSSSPRPKPVKIDASRFAGKEGENLLRWFREVEIAMRARLINDDETKVAFAMSLLVARAKDWAYTEYLADANRFPTWDRFCDLMKATFLPPHSDFRLRSQFLACKQGSKNLYAYVQELRQIAACITQNPLTEDVKVTVFSQGLKQGPARLEVFRRMPRTFEEAVNIAMGEELSHTRATAAPTAPEPMDLSAIQAGSDTVCFNCQGRGHFARDCRAPRSPSNRQQQPLQQRNPMGSAGRHQRGRHGGHASGRSTPPRSQQGKGGARRP